MNSKSNFKMDAKYCWNIFGYEPQPMDGIGSIKCNDKLL